MSTLVKFNGKDCIEPGAYAAMVYNPTSVVNVANFGNVMIIDTGLCNDGTYEFAGGAGIAGVGAKGIKSVYQFTNIEDFLAFMGGGKVADIAQKLFSPIDGAAGCPKLYYTRAATTVPAAIALSFLTGQVLTLTCKNEGVAGNGVADTGVLKVGYAAKVEAGVGVGKFVLRVYKGNFAGVDAAGEPYGTKSLAAATGQLIAESPELSTALELYNWCIANKYIQANFVVTKTGTGATPLVAIAQTLASGGTTAFLSGTEYADVLEAIDELDVTFFLCTKGGANGTDAATNGKLFTFLKTTAKFTEFMAVPGYSGDDDLLGDASSTQSIAKYFDSGQVITTHGAPIVTRKDGNGTKALDPIYLTAAVIGLAAGGAPQTPLTWKRIGYQSFVYDLKKSEREDALQAGILHVRNINGNWCVNQGVTTIQDNLQTYAADGQSLELSIELIKAQINKELILDGSVRFTGKTSAQSSPESVKNFTETKLRSFEAKPGADNLIITWRKVNVTAKNGDYFITYDFVPNVPMNKQFFVGNVLDYTF